MAGFARCLVDRREPGKIRHTLAELLGQRIFGIACGHPDGNDANHLTDDPIHKLLLGRDPVAGEALASQPTISRFENGVGRSALYELGRELAMRVIERHQRRLDGRARRITIDLDPTDDATHGAQQLTFFNGHYDSWCYLPLLAFLTFDQEREQYLCAAVLRPGNVPATRGPWACCAGCCPCCGRPFPRRGFSFGSTGLCDAGDLRLPGCRATARLRGGDGQERRVAAPRRARPARGARPRARPAARPRRSTPTPAIGPARGTATAAS